MTVMRWLKLGLSSALPVTSDQRGIVTIEVGADGTDDQLVTVLRDASGAYVKTALAPRSTASALTMTGATPAIATGSGAGTAGAISSTGGPDSNFAFTLTPGGTGIAAGAVAVVTFAQTRPDGNYNVLPSARNSAAGPVLFYFTSRSSSGFTINVVNALASGTAYNIGFTVIGF